MRIFTTPNILTLITRKKAIKLTLKTKCRVLTAIIILFVLAAGIIFAKFNAASSYIIQGRNFVRYQYYKLKRYTHKIDISNLQPLSETGDEWFAKYHVIAHNGGIIQGRIKSDSLEAWELSYTSLR